MPTEQMVNEELMTRSTEVSGPRILSKIKYECKFLMTSKLNEKEEQSSKIQDLSHL